MAIALTALGSSVPNGAPTVLSGATGAVPLSGVTYITYDGGAGAYTLATPTVDNQVIDIISLTAQAHTITTAANIINGANDTVTFTGATFNYIRLRSFGGQWVSVAADRTNATLSEV